MDQEQCVAAIAAHRRPEAALFTKTNNLSKDNLSKDDLSKDDLYLLSFISYLLSLKRHNLSKIIF